MRTSFIERVLEHEGFESKPYQCTEGVWTFGHGLTFIKEDESALIVQIRLREHMIKLWTDFPWLVTAPTEVLEVLTEMAYQMGDTGVRKFKRTLSHLEAGEFVLASEEMLLSEWARQTPQRAFALSKIIRSLADT